MESLWLFYLCLDGNFFSSTSSISLLVRLSPVSSFFVRFILLLVFLPAVVPCENILCCVDAMRSCLEFKKNRLWQTGVAYEFWAKQLVSVPKLDRIVWIPWAVGSVYQLLFTCLVRSEQPIKGIRMYKQHFYNLTVTL